MAVEENEHGEGHASKVGSRRQHYSRGAIGSSELSVKLYIQADVFR